MTVDVSYAEDGKVALVELARPQVLNAIDEDLCRRLSSIYDEMERSDTVSVAIIHGGASRAFSAGADLTHMRNLAGEELRRFIELTWHVFDRISRSPLLNIAALHGFALGGGAELALCCDLRIAEEGVKIGFPEMSLGSVPGSGAVQRLPEMIGKARAFELMLSGRRVEAAEAERIGLVNKAVPTGQALPQAREWASTFAGRPREAIRYLKAGTRIGHDPVLASAFHGLVSNVCQSAKGYRSNTSAFAARVD